MQWCGAEPICLLPNKYFVGRHLLLLPLILLGLHSLAPGIRMYLLSFPLPLVYSIPCMILSQTGGQLRSRDRK
jgi:hypothetical protein